MSKSILHNELIELVSDLRLLILNSAESVVTDEDAWAKLRSRLLYILGDRWLELRIARLVKSFEERSLS